MKRDANLQPALEPALEELVNKHPAANDEGEFSRKPFTLRQQKAQEQQQFPSSTHFSINPPLPSIDWKASTAETYLSLKQSQLDPETLNNLLVYFRGKAESMVLAATQLASSQTIVGRGPMSYTQFSSLQTLGAIARSMVDTIVRANPDRRLLLPYLQKMHSSDVLAGIVSSAYATLAHEHGIIANFTYGGWGITLDKEVDEFFMQQHVIGERQFWFSKLQGKALQGITSKEQALSFSDAAGEALIGSRHYGESSIGSLSRGHARESSYNKGFTGRYSVLGDNAAAISVNEEDSWQHSVAFKYAFLLSKLWENAFRHSRHADLNLASFTSSLPFNAVSRYMGTLTSPKLTEPYRPFAEREGHASSLLR